MKYALDDKPGLLPMLLYGLQWWITSLPSVLVMGVVVSRMHYTDLASQTLYMQKLFAVMGLVTVIQPLWGHKMPLVAGPATILLVGLIAAQSSGVEAMYTAMIVGGCAMSLAAYSGLLSRLRVFFTPRIVSVILILIAFTICPTILRQILSGPGEAWHHILFALVVTLVLVICNTVLPGVWKSMTVLIGLAGGTAAYGLLFGLNAPVAAAAQGGQASFLLTGLDFHVGTILAFLFCYLALLTNELGSIESVGQMLNIQNMSGRIRRGVGIQGVANVLSGGLGIIGPVDYSLSAGLIAATGCASRYTLVPAGLGLLACAFFPGLVLLLARMPEVVMGVLLLYLMSSQLASGLSMLVHRHSITDFSSGLTVGLPLMVGLLVAYAPQTAFAGMPGMLRPVLANGFVMGTITVMLLEHVIFRKRPIE